MAQGSDGNGTTIDALLQERARYEQWLTRLDASGASAPDTVRQRIRGDYQQRLDAVMQQLRGHGATIGADLERNRGELAELEAERGGAQEAMAEAEIRYAVGEYSPEDWQRIRDEANGTLERLANRLSVVQLEIHRLDEVQRLIVAPAPPAMPGFMPAMSSSAPSAAAAPPAPAPSARPFYTDASATPPPTPSPVSAAPVESPAPRPAPPPSPVAPASQQPAVASSSKAPAADTGVDELAFLKSVTGQDSRRAPRRSNESMARPVEPPPAAAVTHSPVAPPDATYVEPPPPPAATSTAAASGAAKTLKCGECGTLNRPTEWYCERCGGELAAL